MASLTDTTSDTSSGRTSVLGALSQRTRAIALVALIAEALFLVGALALPESERIYAFGICALLLILAMGACAWLESKQAGAPVAPDTPLVLPRAMEGQFLVVDADTKSARGQAADTYRTGLNFKFAGRFGDAITYFRRTLQLAPDHTKARYNIGSCLLYLGKLDEAEAHFRSLADDLMPRAAALDPIHVELLHGSLIQLNAVFSRRGRYAEGTPFLVESLKVKPDDPLSYLNLAVSALKCGNVDEAKRWHQILFAHPEHLEVLSSLSDEDRTAINGLTAK